MMVEFIPGEIAALYAGFNTPIAALDCGQRCSPYNERGVPFCCDTHHAVPAANQSEWHYLQANTGLWKLWEPDDPEAGESLCTKLPQGQVLIACLGHHFCQRSFRSFTCRAFPFFPYINRQGEFLGLSYYWEYENRCWVISNLSIVSKEYLEEFIRTFEAVFERQPEEKASFAHFSVVMRRVFGRAKRAIPLLHRSGKAYKITPRNGRMRQVPVEKLPRYGVYKIAAAMPFWDERE
jgi:hypothetical protein